MTRYSSYSLAVANPEIQEVLDLESGEILSAQATIGEDYEKALQLRMALKQGIAAGKPLFACPLCGVPVHMVSMYQERRFYFRHETEDGRCPAKTKGSLDEKRILAMKYDGVRESVAHIRMKEIIAESLRSDPDFSKVEIEPIWKGQKAKGHRRPDVRALWRETLPVAFEVQLSTTFLRVIAERREFYLREGGLLFWVFKGFDPIDARLTHEDIFYNNNRNAFVVNEETLRTSLATKELVLDCIWSEPSADEGRLLWSMKKGRAKFCDLTIDLEQQRVFLFDADVAKACCEAETSNVHLRESFRKFWTTKSRVSNEEWLALRDRFAERDLILPRYLDDLDGPESLLDTLYSAREGRPIGWGHANLVGVAHHVFDRRKGFLWAFRLLLVAYERGAQIKREDVTGNWRNKKVPAYRTAWTSSDPSFAPDRRFDDLVTFLFPEIADDLKHPPH